MTKTLREVLERVATWPEWAQEELAQFAFEIDIELKAGPYHATEEELAKIDEGLAAARCGEIATDEEVEAAFAKFRRA
jgi:predicted transcriptional regulator